MTYQYERYGPYQAPAAPIRPPAPIRPLKDTAPIRPPTPDLASDLGYRGYLEGHVGARVVNLCNPVDNTTGNIWYGNQLLFKPATGYTADGENFEYSYYPSTNRIILSTNLYLYQRQVTQDHESMAMVAKSRSESIGHGTNQNQVRGIVDTNFDINAAFSFENNHGAQWDWAIQKTFPYYEKILEIIHE